MPSATGELLSSNREVLIVRATQEFVQWLRTLGRESYATKAEGTRQNPGYYLVDAPRYEKAHERGIFPRAERDAIVQSCFRTIFESELADLGLPKKEWPDTSSYEQFQEFFALEHSALIADLGVRPLKTRCFPPEC